MKPSRVNPAFHFNVHYLTLGLFKQKIIVHPNCNVTPFTVSQSQYDSRGRAGSEGESYLQAQTLYTKDFNTLSGKLGVPTHLS